MTRTGTRVGALLLALLVAGSGAAQGQGILTVAPRVGVLASTIEFADGATDAQTRTLVGAQVGFAVTRDLGRFFTGEVGLDYSREGFGAGGAHTGDLRRDQLAVPMLLSFRAPTRISPHLTVGVCGKLALRCHLTGVAAVGATSCDAPPMAARWRRLDMAAVAGMGVTAPAGHRTLSVDVRASWGMRDLNGGGLIPGSAHGVTVGASVALFFRWPRGGGS